VLIRVHPWFLLGSNEPTEGTRTNTGFLIQLFSVLIHPWLTFCPCWSVFIRGFSCPGGRRKPRKRTGI